MAKTQWYFLNNKMRILHYINWKYAAKNPKVSNPSIVNWIQKKPEKLCSVENLQQNRKKN